MSVSSLSMAATATASTTHPPQLHNKLSNLTFPNPPTKHKPLQLQLNLKLKARTFIFLSPLHCVNSTADSLEQLSSEETPDDDDIDVDVDVDVDDDIEEEEEEENEDVQSEQRFEENAQSDDGRLYVGNLPFSMTSSQLSETFSQAGRVSNVEVVYDRVTDRSRGFAFVTMASIEDAREAIRTFDGSQIGGRTVKVNFPEVPRGGERKVLGPKIRESYKAFVDSTHKIYAGNLHWRLTSQGLKDAFAGQPGYLSARVVYERDTGRSRGYGFVSFQSADDVQAAMNVMNGVELEGRPLRLNFATQRVPSSPSGSINDGESRADSAELITSDST